MTLTYTQNMTKPVIKEIWFPSYVDTNNGCTCVPKNVIYINFIPVKYCRCHQKSFAMHVTSSCYPFHFSLNVHSTYSQITTQYSDRQSHKKSNIDFLISDLQINWIINCKGDEKKGKKWNIWKESIHHKNHQSYLTIGIEWLLLSFDTFCIE